MISPLPLPLQQCFLCLCCVSWLRIHTVHLSWLSSRRSSSACCLATLTQGKFVRLKINFVFAEKGC